MLLDGKDQLEAVFQPQVASQKLVVRLMRRVGA